MGKHLRAASIAAAACLGTGIALAQTGPSPGPTNPVPPNPQSKPGGTIVVNPTTDECRAGWNASLRWSKEQFDDFCNKLGASK